jgi:hypothetical protein
MSRLDLTFADIYNQVSDFLGLGTSPSGTNLTKVKNIIYRAYRQFLFPLHPITKRKHTWSFLKKSFHLVTKAGIWKYQLPNDFDEMIGFPQYGDAEPYSELIKVNPDMILSKRAVASVSSFPTEYALYPVSQDAEIGTTWEIWLWPEPNGSNNLIFTYLVNPPKPENTADLILGGTRAGEVLLEMAYAVAEAQEENKIGIHAQIASEMLTAMILADVTGTADFLGKVTNGEQSEIVLRGFARYGTGTDWLYAADR